MADSNIDAYLELRSSGKIVAPGETLDAQFSKTKAIQILTFSMGFDQGDAEADDDDDGESLRDKSSEKVQLDLRTSSRQNRSGGPTRSPLNLTVATKKSRKKKKSPYSFKITKYTDTASSALFQYHCQFRQRPTADKAGAKQDTSAIIQQAKLTFRKGGGGPINFMYLYYENLLVVGFQYKLEGAHPVEEIDFGFDKCELSYDLQTAKGAKAKNKTLVGWDFSMNEAWTHYLEDGSSGWGG